MLSLAEQLLLLSFDRRSLLFRAGIGVRLPHGLLGAGLLELMLRGQVEVRGDSLVLIDRTLTHDPLLDQIAAAMSYARLREGEPVEQGPTQSALQWLHALDLELADVSGQLAAQLEKKGVLSHIHGIGPRITALQTRLTGRLAGQIIAESDEPRGIFWLLKPQVHYVDRDVHSHLIERVRFEILGDGEPDAWITALTGLLLALDMMNCVFATLEYNHAESRVRKAVARNSSVLTIYSALDYF